MERRKLMRPLDDYIHSISQAQEDVAEKTQFYNSLRHFYRKKWGCPLKVPSIHGVELDLHLLYETVLGLGGWSKVSNHEKWPQVLHELGIDEDIQVAEHAVRMLYMRFLSKYEQAETGNDPDEHDSDLMGSRSRMKGHLSFANSEAPTSVPKSIGMAQESGPEYQKILKSLLSGLPNEVDFAVNVCSLLSHPGPYLLRLAECPQLMTALVAHCCIFNDGPSSLEDLHLNAWQQQSTHDFATFWTKAGIEDTAVLSLMPPTCQTSCSCCSSSQQLDFEDDRFDLKNSVNWRVFQILSIFRNLSFEECNKCAMASNLPLLKFLLICCNSKWQQLVNGAFDILSNISTEINLTMEGSVLTEHLLLKTVSMGLFSDDKFQILRSIEIFTGLCNNKCNETLICEFAEEKILSRIFTLVTAKDILLCIITLESLYQMSELGRTSCEVLSTHNRSIDILVDLATTDAASFGASGLAGIKVVEIHGHTGQLQPYHPQRSNHSMPVPLLPVRPSSPATSRSLYSSPPPPSSPSVVRHHFAPPPSPLAVARPPMTSTASGTGASVGQVVQKLVARKGHAMPTKIHTVTRTSAVKTFVPAGSMSSPPPAVQEVVAAIKLHANAPTPSAPVAIVAPSQGQESKLERMTKSYIYEHCSAEEKAVSNRGEMYAHYVEYMQSHDMLSGSLQMFINQLKACFPSITITHSPGTSVHSVEGIRFSKVVSNGNSHNLAAQHPLMQQMLSSPTLNGHVDKDHLSDSEAASIPKIDNSASTTSENNNQNDCPMVNGHLFNPEKLNHHKEWSKKSLANGETLCNGDLEEKECGVAATNGDESHAKMSKMDENEEKQAKLGDEEEGEGEVVKNPKTTIPNGLITPVTLRGRKRGSTNGTPKTWSKKPKAVSRTSTSSSLSSVPETTGPQTPVPTKATSSALPPARCSAIIDTAQPSTSAPPGDYMCEWDCCGRFFHSGSCMLYHNTHYHLNSNSEADEEQDDAQSLLICKWPSCDGTPRSKWSMVTHLQDHHCTEQQLQSSLRMRREMGHYNYMAYLKQQLEKVKEISHHPGYSKFAALEAIRRHAFSYMTKDLTDDSEGPVTRSLRLTSSLILRNIAKHSVEGRRKIRKHESHLSWMALSRMESSAALAQCLGELAEHSALANLPENEVDMQQSGS